MIIYNDEYDEIIYNYEYDEIIYNYEYDEIIYNDEYNVHDKPSFNSNYQVSRPFKSLDADTHYKDIASLKTTQRFVRNKKYSDTELIQLILVQDKLTKEKRIYLTLLGS